MKGRPDTGKGQCFFKNYGRKGIKSTSYIMRCFIAIIPGMMQHSVSLNIVSRTGDSVTIFLIVL